jgi:sialate O-acetylesterase
LEVTLTQQQATPDSLEANSESSFGVTFTHAPKTWQLISANDAGKGSLRLRGRWRRPATAGILGRNGCLVELRLTHMASGLPVHSDLDWFAAQSESDGTWQAEMVEIPFGGPYRIESRLNPKGNKTREWAWRGDQIAWLLVGDAYVIAGQSNASGYGAPPYPDDPEMGIHLFGMDGQWKLATHPLHEGTQSQYHACLQPFVPGHSGFLHMAKVLRRHTQCPIAFIPCALGGSALIAWSETGDLFKTMVQRVNDAEVKPKGILFVQGETDAKGQQSETYGPRFQEAVSAWRMVFENPTLPIFTVQLGRYYSKNPREDDLAWSRVRHAQGMAAETISHCFVVPALDLPLSDSIHYSTLGHIILGERLAHLIRQMVYQHPLEARPPRLIAATLTQTQRIELVFDPVVDRLDCFDPASNPFEVKDDMGNVSITRVVYPMNHRIELHIERVLVGKAKVSGGGGENPSVLPLDVDRRMPILAFYQYEVATNAI